MGKPPDEGMSPLWYEYQNGRIWAQGAQGAASRHFAAPHLVHVSLIDRFYKGAISQVEVEKFWGIGPES